MRVGPGIDQLRIHAHAIGRTLHAALEQMGHAKLLADLAQVARDAALVLHDAGATDHLQVRDLRQVMRISSCTPSVKKALSGSRLRFSNGSTAMLFSGITEAGADAFPAKVFVTVRVGRR